MSAALDAFRSHRDRITIPTSWVAFALSILLHALLLLGWAPNAPMAPLGGTDQGKPGGSLAVRLAPPPSVRPSAAPAPLLAIATHARPAPAYRSAAPIAGRRQPSAPPVLALERPAPSAENTSLPDAARTSVGGDLASYIAARRRAREPMVEPASAPAETEQERDNRLAAERLGLNRTPSFGSNQNRGGGIFQVERVGYNDAEFFFFGWNKAIRRNSRQMIEVRRGDNPTMEIAVVRKMIAIIREHTSGDFEWESQRNARTTWLSARVADNARLEEFLMQDFFPDRRSRH